MGNSDSGPVEISRIFQYYINMLLKSSLVLEGHI